MILHNLKLNISTLRTHPSEYFFAEWVSKHTPRIPMPSALDLGGMGSMKSYWNRSFREMLKHDETVASRVQSMEAIQVRQREADRIIRHALPEKNSLKTLCYQCGTT